MPCVSVSRRRTRGDASARVNGHQRGMTPGERRGTVRGLDRRAPTVIVASEPAAAVAIGRAASSRGAATAVSTPVTLVRKPTADDVGVLAVAVAVAAALLAAARAGCHDLAHTGARQQPAHTDRSRGHQQPAAPGAGGRAADDGIESFVLHAGSPSSVPRDVHVSPTPYRGTTGSHGSTSFGETHGSWCRKAGRCRGHERMHPSRALNAGPPDHVSTDR
jgi:hypothetical protein